MAAEVREQYDGLVSPELLEAWARDPLKAPGRMLSSPWPDRIEIATVTEDGPDRYVVTGDIVEVTSAEVTSGGAADRIPCRLVVQSGGGDWAIVEYTRER